MKKVTKHKVYVRNFLAHRSQPSPNTVSFWANFAEVFTYPTDIESEKKLLEDVFLSPYSEDAHHMRSYFNQSINDIEDEDSAIHAIR